MRKHPLGLALLDDASVPHDEHALCDGADKRQIVRDKEQTHPMPLLKVQQEGDNLCLYGDIERRGRLVADENLRVYGHCTCNGGTLALSAAHLVRIACGVGGGEPNLRQQIRDALLCIPHVGCTQATDRLANHRTDCAARVE